MGLLLVGSGLLSGSETAIFSLQPAERRRLRDGSRVADRLLVDPTRLLVTLLLGNLVVNVAYFSVSAGLVLEQGSTGASAAVALGSLVGMVVLGEILPKTLALVRPAALVRRLAPVLLVVRAVLAPLVIVGQAATHVIESAIAGTGHSTVRPDTEDFKTALRGASSSYHAVELALLHDVVDFGVRRARTHMTPRVDVARLDAQASRQEWLALLASRPFKDYPLVDGSPDALLGTVNAATVLADPLAPLEELVEPALVAPVSIRSERLVLRMQAEGRRLAILLDEFGGMAGVVGLGALSGAVLGEIEPLLGRSGITRHGDTVLARGSVPTHVLREELGLELAVRRADTLAGALAEALGRVPVRGDELRMAGWRLRVAAVRRGRVELVAIRPSRVDGEDAP